MRSILRRLARRHSTAVAYLALFAALGGSAYAAAAVTGNDIKDGTITGSDVKNRSLGTKKLTRKAVSALTGQRGPAGPQGPAGVQGAKGDRGPQGPGATSFSTTVPQGSTVVLATLDNNLTLDATCGAASQFLNLHTTDGGMDFQASGTQFHSGNLIATNADGGTTGIPGNGARGDIDVIARGNATGKFVRVDAHGSFGSPCRFWGMTIPSR